MRHRTVTGGWLTLSRVYTIHGRRILLHVGTAFRVCPPKINRFLRHDLLQPPVLVLELARPPSLVYFQAPYLAFQW